MPQEAIAILCRTRRRSARTLGDRILEAEILRGLAKAHMLQSDHATARDYVTRSVSIFEKARSKPFLGVALRTLAEVEAAAEEEGSLNKADAAFRQSLSIFDELGNDVELAKTCETFSAFLQQSAGSDPNRALEAAALRDRALEIHGKQLASETYALPPLEGDQTNPGVEMPEPEI